MLLQVDFFSHMVKALELQQVLSAMRLLGTDIAPLSDPYSQFRLDASTQLPPPKWSQAASWGAVDDSMLLLGTYLYGIGAWERLATDDGLGLQEKLAGAVKEGPRAGDKQFPQGAFCAELWPLAKMWLLGALAACAVSRGRLRLVHKSRKQHQSTPGE